LVFSVFNQFTGIVTTIFILTTTGTVVAVLKGNLTIRVDFSQTFAITTGCDFAHICAQSTARITHTIIAGFVVSKVIITAI
jgi:hypothetical protein